MRLRASPLVAASLIAAAPLPAQPACAWHGGASTGAWGATGSGGNWAWHNSGVGYSNGAWGHAGPAGIISGWNWTVNHGAYTTWSWGRSGPRGLLTGSGWRANTPGSPAPANGVGSYGTVGSGNWGGRNGSGPQMAPGIGKQPESDILAGPQN